MFRTRPRKALISISSFHGAIFPDGSKTGLFFTEALHPFQVLTEAGFEVDLTSETGTYGLDQVSLTPPFLAGADKAVFDNANHPFVVKLNSQLIKASDLKKGEYSLFFTTTRVLEGFSQQLKMFGITVASSELFVTVRCFCQVFSMRRLANRSSRERP